MPEDSRRRGREMDAYTSFAQVYDLFMDNVPYEEWAQYVKVLLDSFGVREGLLLDLGCGTGSLTEQLAGFGYDMIGVDNAEEMLEIAMEKRVASGHDILYLLQDMREFELYGTVAAVVSICDSMNYLTELSDVEQVMRLANNYLDPGGVFIFDLNTEYKYREILADNTFAEEREESSFIWENFYDEGERVNEYDLTLFIREGELYRKFKETHYQRAFTLKEICGAAERAGMEFVAAYDAFTQLPVKEDSQRMYVILREHGKERK
jgi:SAM-dependent methyltransferase